MTLLVLAAAGLLAAPGAPGAPATTHPDVQRPGPGERCPVCGMFVAKHPTWLATLTFRDGTRAVFDGPKDLFKLWLEPARYLPGRRRGDVAALTVTDYYTLTPIDGRTALYVEGSDVLGPMGRELIPFADRASAEEFLRDHRGRAILRLEEVTLERVRALDE